MEKELKYAKSGIRIGAYLIDTTAIMMVVMPITYLNITEYKNFALYLLITLVGVLYKPLMEFYYQATLGKILLNLKVTNLVGSQIDLKQSFMRSLIFIAPTLLLIPIQYLAFNNPEIVKINSFMRFSQAVVAHYPIQQVLSNSISLIFIVDLIFMLTDKEKRQRSLHDRIGKTFVLKTN